MTLQESQELLKELLVKFYKLPETEVDSLTNESAKKADTLAAITEKDTQRVQKIKEPLVGKFDEGKKAGKKDALTELETAVKTKYGIDSDLQGAELIDAVVLAKAAPGGQKEITEDDVKKHPAYQTAEKTFKQQVKDTQKEWETKLAEREKQFGRQTTLSKVTEKALEKLPNMKPVIPGNALVAANIQKTFLKDFEEYEYDFQDKDNPLVMKDGKVVTDAHGHSLDFDQLVASNAAKYYEFQANNGGGNAGNGGAGTGGSGGAGGGKPGYPAGIQKPKTYEDLTKIVEDQNIKVEDRAIVMQTWKDEQQAGTP